jgi:hypothetical protein
MTAVAGRNFEVLIGSTFDIALSLKVRSDNDIKPSLTELFWTPTVILILALGFDRKLHRIEFENQSIIFL